MSVDSHDCAKLEEDLAWAKEEASLLRALLLEAIEAMKEEVNNRDGVDRFNLGCGNCEAGVPVKHSMGCRIESALKEKS